MKCTSLTIRRCIAIRYALLFAVPLCLGAILFLIVVQTLSTDGLRSNWASHRLAVPRILTEDLSYRNVQTEASGSTTSCTTPSIMYSPLAKAYSGEQFFAQLNHILELVYLGYTNGRKVVLPDVIIMPQNDTKFEEYFAQGVVPSTDTATYVEPFGIVSHPLTRYFDLTSLSAYVPYELQRAIDDRHIDTLVSFRDKTEFPVPPAKSTVVLADDLAWHVSQTCHASDSDSSQKIGNACVLGVEFRRGTFVSSSANWNVWVKDDFLRLFRTFRPRPRLERLALRFIQKKFGTLPYLAIHWRRGDMTAGDAEKGMERYLANSAANLVSFLRPILEQNSIQAVFLMTNSGSKEELAYVKAHLPNVQQMMFITDADSVLRYDDYVNEIPSLRWQFAQEETLVQALISTHSTLFIGHGIDYSTSSGVSRFVYNLRMFIGKQPSSFLWRGLQ